MVIAFGKLHNALAQIKSHVDWIISFVFYSPLVNSSFFIPSCRTLTICSQPLDIFVTQINQKCWLFKRIYARLSKNLTNWVLSYPKHFCVGGINSKRPRNKEKSMIVSSHDLKHLAMPELLEVRMDQISRVLVFRHLYVILHLAMVYLSC